METEQEDKTSGNIGKEGKWDIDFEDGKIKVKVGYDGQQVDAKVEVSMDASQFLDMLAKKIPGKLDDMIIDGLKAALL